MPKAKGRPPTPAEMGERPQSRAGKPPPRERATGHNLLVAARSASQLFCDRRLMSARPESGRRADIGWASQKRRERTSLAAFAPFIQRNWNASIGVGALQFLRCVH